MTGTNATRSGLGGMTDLLRRLEDMEVHCLGKAEGKAETLDSKDKFLSLKANMNRDLAEMKGKIYERREILKSCGTSHEVIQLTSQIRVLELKLKEDLIQLKEIYRKQCDGSAFVFTGNSSRPSPEELSGRYEAMDKLAYQMEEARKSFRTGQDMDGDYDQVKIRQQLMNDSVNSNTASRRSSVGEGGSILQKEFRSGELDDDEKEAMNRWSERERQLDEELLHVSVAVDRLKPLAQEINAAGQKQEKMISAITNRVDKATSNLRQVNVRLRKFVDTNRRSTFIFRIVLILVLLGLGGFIYVKAKNKNSG